MWDASQGTGLLRQALSEIQKIWKCIDVASQNTVTLKGGDVKEEKLAAQYLLRKLTPL
jgi:hypothetical protein